MTTAETRDLNSRAFELKFLVDPDTGARVRAWARARLNPDPHGQGDFRDEYCIASLYFDTPDFDVYQRRGSYGRSKYRIRRYDGEPNVFLERKLRRDTRLSKRRTALALPELARVADATTAWGGAWFARRVAIRRLMPVLQVTYARTAREAMHETGRIRLTLDESIRAIPRGGLAFDRDPGTLVVPDWLVLEVKYHVAIPSLFKELVETFQLDAGRASKYRFAAEGLGLTLDSARGKRA